MIKKLLATGGLFSTLLIAGVLTLVAVPRHQVLALAMVSSIEFYVWWRRHDSNLELVANTYASWLTSLVAVVLVAISPQVIAQFMLIGLYVIFRLLVHLEVFAKQPGTLALIMQFIALGAIFSAAQVWRWPAAIVMVFAWGASWFVARGFLLSMNDKQAALLAGVWALVVAELAWIMSWWMIAYLSPGAYLIIPQAALLITGLAYVLGGIYRLHRSSQLSRNRLIEYLVVAGVLLAIILAGTRWNAAS
jgi:hypothetical protein